MYLYGHKIGDDFNISEIAETYAAADKYLVDGLNDVLFRYVKQNLDTFNCLIYDQLIKNQKANPLILDPVKCFIKLNTKQVVENEFFTKIDEDTLLDLLTMDGLSISEIELLKACARWVNEQLLRKGLTSNPENKREIFKPIKNYIKFSDFSFDQMKGFDEIYDLLTVEETASFFAHLLNESRPLSIECKTKRKTINLYSIFSNLSDSSINLSCFYTSISANQTCFIRMISTSLHKSIDITEMSIEKDKEKLELSFEKKVIDDYWCFNFEDGFKMNSYVYYRLYFKLNETKLPKQVSNNTKLELKEGETNFVFNFAPVYVSFLCDKDDSYHCIEKIDFYVYEN